MGDVVPFATRSRMMAGIRSRDTAPELLVRRELHRLGFRYRLHVGGLPGRPDIVLPRWRAVVFVQGCFWHGHDCHLFRWPQTREQFWRDKIQGNRERDTRNLQALHGEAWRVCLLWECALKGKNALPLCAVTQCLAQWLRAQQAPLLEIRGQTAGA